MPSDSAAGWSCVARHGVWSFPVAAAASASAGGDNACSACKSPLRGEFRCRLLSQFTCIVNNCFPQLSLFLKSALSNHSFSLNHSPRNPHPYSFSSFEVAKHLLVFSAVILLLLFKLLGRKPACKLVGLFLFFLPSDSAILNSLIFYLTHQTFWLGSCPFFYFWIFFYSCYWRQNVSSSWVKIWALGSWSYWLHTGVTFHKQEQQIKAGH